MADERFLEALFYGQYQWCLNPALSVDDLLRLREEADRFKTLSGWQREESKVNLYLFACAIACTVDDYFAFQWKRLELGIADPACDLAAAIFELRLFGPAEHRLIGKYRRQSGDTSISERVPLHKILYGSIAMKHAMNAIAAGQAQKNRGRRHDARNLLVASINDFCARLIGAGQCRTWSGPLFILDLDGVFDQALLAFPHATESGLESLALRQTILKAADRGRVLQLLSGRSWWGL
jgi:hypothetical protein